MNEYKLLKGNNIELLKTLDDNSVDAVVTDPPYALTSIKNRYGKEGSAPAKFGTGGLNIDGCRIGDDIITTHKGDKFGNNIYNNFKKVEEETYHEGRFPSNIIFDEAGKILDEQSGNSKSQKNNCIRKGSSLFVKNYEKEEYKRTSYIDEGGASRFFYCAKASTKERNLGCEDIEHEVKNQKGHGLGRECSICGTKMLNKEECKCENPNWIINQKNGNIHPTVKPVNLMTYLVRLVAPPTATILDPFMGSGSTGIATLLEGHNFIGMEMDEEYYKIAEERIKNYEKYKIFIK